MGCGGQKSEFDCVLSLGQDKANSAFASHWSSWITQDDITEMVSYGLNTIRVPVGYWMREDLVYSDSEHFPQGGLQYLENLCGWASDAGLYIITVPQGLRRPRIRLQASMRRPLGFTRITSSRGR